MNPSPAWQRLGAGILGVIVGVLGLTVMLGWHLHARAVVQPVFGEAPQQFNAAFCFLLGGGALLLLASRRNAWAAGVAAAAALIGLATSLEWVTGRSLGIDLLLVPRNFHLDANAGRMAFTSALGFTLMGSLLAIAARRTLRLRWAILGLGGSALVALGAVGIIGHVVGLESLGLWHELSRMPGATAVEFMLIGVGLILFAAHEEYGRVVRGLSWQSAAVSLGTLVLMLGLWYAVRAYEIKSDVRANRMVAEQLATEFRMAVDSHVRAMDRQAARWDRRAPTREEWEADARSYVEGSIFPLSLYWVDSLGADRWHVHANGDELPQAAPVVRSIMRLPGLAPARQEGRPVFVGPMKLTSTAAGFFVVHPVLDNGRNGGYLVGAFDLSRFFARAAQPLLAEYAVAMSVDDKVWLSQGTPSSAGIPAATASVPIGDIRWTLRLTPLRGPNTALSWVFAFLGLAMSALLANVVRLGDKARSRSRYLETIIDSSPVGMLLVEPSGLIVRANDTACALFGYEKDEPVGKRFEALMFAGGSGPADLPRPELLATGDSLIRTSLEVEALRRDGTTFMVELGVGTVALEEGRLVLAIVQDITPRYEAQKELQQRTEDLGRSNRDLEQFAYVASHDLRAPLRAVDHLSQWLTEDLDAHMTEEQRGNGRLLRRRVQRMERLLSDLLEYARVTRVHMKAELVDTTDLLNDVVAMLDWPPGFTFRPSLGLPVFETNRTALRLVFANLIGNAIKHHDRTEGRIEVEAMDAGAFHRFRVSDDGPGIPTRYHGKAFEMFQTLRPRDEVEGSGMGLALVKRLVESRGGMITVESPDTRGTTFLFTWPKKWKEGPAT